MSSVSLLGGLYKCSQSDDELTYEWNGERGSRNGVGDHQQEDGEREQDGDAERDLLSGVGRQEEPDENERGQHEARQDDVHQVELVAASQRQREDDVCVAVARAAREHRHVPVGRRAAHLPLAVLLELVRRHLRHAATAYTVYPVISPTDQAAVTRKHPQRAPSSNITDQFSGPGSAIGPLHVCVCFRTITFTRNDL